MASPSAIPILMDLIRDKKPMFVFLIETICDVAKCDEIKTRIGYDHIVSVGRVGV